MFYEKNRIWLISVTLFVLGGCSSPQKDKNLEASKTSYFAEVPIVKYSKGHVPCVSMQLQGKNLIMELDLGFCGGLDVSPKFIERLKDKQSSYTKSVYVATGKEYKRSTYFIKKLNIGQTFFTGKIALEDGYTGEQNQETVLIPSKPDLGSRDDGKIGWHLFSTCALLIDSKQSKIAFADSFETFRKNGYFQKEYGSAPLLLDRELPEVEISSALGNLRCVVDTGATMNILHKEVEGFDLACVETSSVSSLCQYPLKPLVFRPLWIKLPISVQAILGMDFFSDHLVALDFPAARIYVQKYDEAPLEGNL